MPDQPAPDSPEAIRRANAGQPLPIGLVGECRIVVRAALLVAALAVFVPLHYLFRWIRYGSPFPMLFLRFACRIIGGRVQVHGVPLRREVFFIANHISWLDILAIGGANGSAFVSRGELRQNRALGWLAGMNRTVFTQRAEKLNIAAQINDLREAMADTWAITIFPEGTVTDGYSLLPFKTSFLHVLEPPPSGVLVQPLVIDYGPLSEWIAWLGEETGIDNARRLFARPGNFPIDIYFLDPIDPRAFPGRKAIAAEARRQIEQCLVGRLGRQLRPFRFDMPSIGYVAPSRDGLNAP